MTASLKKHSEMLRFLGNAKPPAVKAVLQTASPELMRILCECCHNVLKGNVRLNPRQKRLLCRHKRNLRALVAKQTSVKRRKQILQTGGFIGLLLKPVLGALKGLLNF